MPEQYRHYHDLGTRIQALALFYAGHPVDGIVDITGMSKSAIYKLKVKAEGQGYDPKHDSRLLIQHVQDLPRSGRPKKDTANLAKRIVKILSKNRNRCEINLEELAYKNDVSPTLVRRLLKNMGYKKVKPTYKPGLNQAQRDARLAFALEHKYWTIED